jgi:hypothetical protein
MLGMLQPCGEPDLADESVHTDCARELRMDDLDRDQPIQPTVAGEPDGGHAAEAQLALHGVPFAQCCAEAIEHVRPRGGAGSTVVRIWVACAASPADADTVRTPDTRIFRPSAADPPRPAENG